MGLVMTSVPEPDYDTVFTLIGVVMICIGAILMVGSHQRAIRKPKNEDESRIDGIFLLGIIMFLFGCIFTFTGYYD